MIFPGLRRLFRRTLVKVQSPVFRVDEVSVIGPNDFKETSEPRKRSSVVMTPTDSGKHFVVAKLQDPFNSDTGRKCIISISEKNELPDDLKIIDTKAKLPRLSVPTQPPREKEPGLPPSIFAGRFSGAAFTPNGQQLWVSYPFKQAELWDLKKMSRIGSYSIDFEMKAICLDKHGRLYCQRSYRGDSRAPREICVFDKLDPTNKNDAIPEPREVLNVSTNTPRMLSSQDGAWIYYLDTHRNQLGRIGVEKIEVHEPIDLGNDVENFCISPNGKYIYCCSMKNRIDIVSTADFKLVESLPLTKGAPRDVSATDDGRLFFVGEIDKESLVNSYWVDTRKKENKLAKPQSFQVGVRNSILNSDSVAMLPQQDAIVFSSNQFLHVCSIPNNPDIYCPKFIEQRVDQVHGLVPEAWLNSDGTACLHVSGYLLNLSRERN